MHKKRKNTNDNTTEKKSKKTTAKRQENTKFGYGNFSPVDSGDNSDNNNLENMFEILNFTDKIFDKSNLIKPTPK